MTSTALYTDHYELTMLDAALQAGTAGTPVTFEVFTRSLPPGRLYGVFGGLGRLLDALEAFRFGPAEIDWLAQRRVVSEGALDWLAGFRFDGDVDAYREGDLFTGGSPVLAVHATFGQGVLLETIVLSILNHDSAVASAASLIAAAAAGRPVIEMGSRRTDASAAVAAARAAYLGGFASTSNLEAGRRYGIPTAGTCAHAFIQAFPSEEDAFAAQVAALGPATTLLVDTYDTAEGIRRAVDAAGPALGAVRIDSGDLATEAVRARSQLDSLGAPGARIILTGDLDDRSIRGLAGAPVDGFGVGTGVVTGLGYPTAGFIYKVVDVDGRPVAKRSPGKATVGGRKQAWRRAAAGEEVVLLAGEPPPEGARQLQTRVIARGERADRVSLEEARAFHRRVLAEHPAHQPLLLAGPGGPSGQP